MTLTIVPLTLKQANDLVSQLHRHHKPVQGHRFSLGVVDELWTLVGAAIVGRPVAFRCPQYEWVEVTRLVTDGTKNACSALYSACARAAKEMGFKRIQTYILEEEHGTSLKASSWQFESLTRGGDWNAGKRKGRRVDQPQQAKQRWFRELNA